MKRKTIVLLSSILASSLVVGGAFATFAVTDNAEKTGITITAGDLKEDTETYVTLSWGQSTSLAGIGNFAVGETRKAGVVALASTQAYEGIFSLNISDTTVRANPVDASKKLISYLNVYVYEGSSVALDDEGKLPKSPDPVATIAYNQTTAKEISFAATGSTSGTEYSIFVQLDVSSVSQYASFTEDTVYLEVDWSPKDGEEATGGLVYFTKPSNYGQNDKVYAYAWKGTDANGAWPGVEMINVYDDLYCLSVLNSRMGYVIFTNNNGIQTEDIPFTGYSSATPYWDGTKWDEEPKQEVAPEITATKNGNPLELVDTVTPGDQQNDHIYQLTLAKGDVIVVKKGLATVTFGSGANEFTAELNNTYTFYYSKDGRIYVDAPYKVVVTKDWSTLTTYDLEFNEESHEYQVKDDGTFELALGDFVKVSNGAKWFPEDGGSEYEVTVAGTYKIYFKPDGTGNEDWHYHYFYLAKQSA